MNGELIPKNIVKRNGVVAGFQIEKIEHAMFKAIRTVGTPNKTRARELIKESANSAYSIQGLNQLISTLITSQYWLRKLYPDNISEDHKKGIIIFTIWDF